MKTIFDKSTNDQLIARISLIDENSTAKWGKMTVYQMLKHCTLWEEMLRGDKVITRMFLGRLIGRIALKGVLKDEKPMSRNAPTVPGFEIKDHGNVLEEKARWIAMAKEHPYFANDNFIHPFFGKMTKEQIGYLAYKHSDHHLRQFNC